MMTQIDFRSREWQVGTNMLLGSSLLFGLEFGLFESLAKTKHPSDTRYTSEWLPHMVANGIISCDYESQVYWLNDEQRAVLLDEWSPVSSMHLA